MPPSQKHDAKPLILAAVPAEFQNHNIFNNLPSFVHRNNSCCNAPKKLLSESYGSARASTSTIYGVQPRDSPMSGNAQRAAKPNQKKFSVSETAQEQRAK